MKIKEVIVVEGKKDSAKVKQAVKADTIETNGAAVNETVITLIKHAQETRGVIIFTDPDYPGQRIRAKIQELVPNCKHAYLSRSEAKAPTKNKSLGIEHASIETIRTALKGVYEVRQTDKQPSITKHDLIQYGLIGSKNSKIVRQQLGTHLRIGYANGKQLLKRLQLFQISANELDEAMQHILGRSRG